MGDFVAKTSGSKQQTGKYIEIINWKKAQPKMKDGPNAWMKLYTSLLDHDGFGGMNDSARVLLIGLWLYAARTGHYILPADPKWLHRKIPMLHAEPNLKPLLEAKDIFGHPTPFLQYCDHPQVKKAKEQEFEAAKDIKKGKDGAEKPAKPKKNKRAQKPGTDVATRAHARSRPRSRESRVEESRLEKTRVEPSTLTGFGKEKEERETLSGFSKEESRAEESTADQKRAEQRTATADQNRPEPEKPENPMESEAGGAIQHIVPTPPHSVRRSGPQAIGLIIRGRFPDHWMDADAEAFGWEIIEALGMPSDRSDENTRSEWGAFASWWCQVKHAAPGLMLGELRSMAIGKAVWIHAGPKKPKNVRNPRALWTHIMDKELVHHGITLPPARASPQVKVQS